MKTESNIEILIINSFEGNLSSDEKEMLNSWLNEDPKNQTHYDDLKNIWDKSSLIQNIPNVNVDLEWDKFKTKNFGQEKGRLISLFAKASFKYAAAVLITLFSASIYFSGSTTYQTENNRETVSLADGSIIELNSHSTLKVSRMFNWFNRSMKLDGEAYFDVQRNPSMPFTISSSRANIEVLGTSFNFNSKAENPIVSVTSGRVAFWNENKENALYLEKGEEGISNKGELIQQNIQDENFLGWFEGVFNFKEEQISSALKSLASYYNVEFELENYKQLKDCNITTHFNKNSLEEVLSELEILMNFKIVKTNKVYHLTDGYCL